MKEEIAILLAAGKGERMLPLSFTTPKPLIRVFGTPMIETNIKALRHRGVKKIYVVVGYKKEQFSYLADAYDNVVLVENKEFQTKNNMSSIYALGKVLGSADCFLSDADLYLPHTTVYDGVFEKTVFFAKYEEGKTAEWFYEMAGNRVEKIVKGGEKGYQMADISYWRKEDAQWLRQTVAAAYQEGKSDNLLWEQIISEHLGEIPIGIHQVGAEEITELDTMAELCAFDPAYGG